MVGKPGPEAHVALVHLNRPGVNIGEHYLVQDKMPTHVLKGNFFSWSSQHEFFEPIPEDRQPRALARILRVISDQEALDFFGIPGVRFKKKEPREVDFKP